MKNKSRIRITDLSSQIQKPELKPLSDAETTRIVGGGECPWCLPGRPGRPSWG